MPLPVNIDSEFDAVERGEVGGADSKIGKAAAAQKSHYRVLSDRTKGAVEVKETYKV